MKYTSSLLQKYLSIKDTPENIANKLILKTVEIEEVIKREIPDSIVVGKVLSCEDHPDSDHLHICQVDCGEKGQFQIVCGANNVKAGMLVPVALEGTPFPKAGITIAKRKLRGVESNGMICSKTELDIPEDADKHEIRDLQQDLDLEETDRGTPLIQKFPRLKSFVFEVESKGLTNRPDLTGHFGLAWELNAIYQGQITYNKLPEIKQSFEMTNMFELLRETLQQGKRKILTQTDDLNTYLLLELEDITVQRSSFFLRLQGLDLGQGEVNNRVDFSNLFMNLTGQPIHFFDADLVEGDIIVRNAKAGETFVDLFGKEHQLLENDVLVCDQQKILCL